MKSAIRASTAHHEAGHAVVAHRLGATVEKIAFETNSAKEGGVAITVKGLPLETRLLISLAGPLAEAKYEAARASNCEVRFNLARIESILSVAYKEGFLEESDPLIHFESDAHGPIQFRPEDMNLFSDLQSLCESRVLEQTDQQQFGKLVCRAMTYLDEVNNWRSVKVVAEELVAVGTVSRVRFVELMAAAKS